MHTELHWDGQTLTIPAKIDGRELRLQASRDVIHLLPLYNDAVTWEIERYKADIAAKLMPSLAQHASSRRVASPT